MEVQVQVQEFSHGKNGDDQAFSPVSTDGSSKAATRVQKVYRSYRTRRRLADSAVVAEELWWQLIDFARLNHSTISFFQNPKPESVANRWARIGMNASKVGQGLSKDSAGLKLAFQHWIEAIDPQHRYGHNLHIYYDIWAKSQAGQPFFYWLDCGDGKEVDLESCPRSLLRKQCIKYLGPQEREHYEYVVDLGKITHKKSGVLFDTKNDGLKDEKWIFVLSTDDKLYAGLKKKGMFHHSSFLAGGATKAAGRLTAENGILTSVWAYSGHYKPGEQDLNNFINFLKNNGVDMDHVQIRSSSNEDYYDGSQTGSYQNLSEQVQNDDLDETLEKTVLNVETLNEPSQTETLIEPSQTDTHSQTLNPNPQTDTRPSETLNSDQTPKTLNPNSKTLARIEVPSKTLAFDRSLSLSLSGGIKSPRSPVPESAVIRRIVSKRSSKSYQLATQLSRKWSTGAGPRIGCVADYPLELRLQAMDFTSFSPRVSVMTWRADLAAEGGGAVSPAVQSVA